MAAAARTQARSPGAARALLVTLAALWALRALAIFAPGRYLWGLDLGRDLAPVAVWTAWGLAALTLLPALSRPLAERIPGGARAGATIAIVLALGAGAWMATHPDRVRFTGDSDLRGESILSVANPDQFLPQAMPGDRWLHVSMPLLMRAKGVPPSIYNHALGALLATLSVLIAWRLSRVLDLRGAAALGVMVVAASTGAFALYGGYAKGSVELVVLTFAAGVSAVAIARGREGPLPLALLVSAGICMHRAGLTLLPLWLAALAGELATRRAAALRHADLWLALGLLLQLLPHRPGELRCTFVAVGHGGCTVIETQAGRDRKSVV